jgi:hypothetical protein
MRELYRERIERQQKLRAGDPLTIKVLVNARQQQAQGGEPTPPPELPVPPPAPPARDAEDTHIYVSAFDLRPDDPAPIAPPVPSGSARRVAPVAGLHPASVREQRQRSRRALAVGAAGGLALGVAGAVGAWYLRGPAVVVLSEPPGAAVLADDERLGVTPLVLDRLWVPPDGRVLKLSLADHRDQELALAPSLAAVVRLEATLPTALGAVRIESEPPGAEVRVDGKEVGVTPLEVPGLRLDQPHRFDLLRHGFEPDSFIVRPDDAGRSFRRMLIEEPSRSARGT